MSEGRMDLWIASHIAVMHHLNTLFWICFINSEVKMARMYVFLNNQWSVLIFRFISKNIENIDKMLRVWWLQVKYWSMRLNHQGCLGRKGVCQFICWFFWISCLIMYSKFSIHYKSVLPSTLPYDAKIISELKRIISYCISDFW